MKKGQLAKILNKYLKSIGYTLAKAKTVGIDNAVVIDNLPWPVSADNIVQNCPGLDIESVRYISQSTCIIKFKETEK